MTLLVLYEELAAYFINCVSVFSELNNCTVHIIHRKANKEAPFRFEMGNIKSYDRSLYTDEQLEQLARDIAPDAILCGGWSTKVYLRISKSFQKKIPVVLGFDNKWTGSLKQQLIRVAGFYLRGHFNRCFVPGPEQKEFARKIGFGEAQIATGAYCCDYSLFHSHYLANRETKTKHFPHKFIYVGRYVEHKGLQDLWTAFIELQSEHKSDWQLWCLGTGDLQPVQHESIRHFGFVQPSEMSGYIRDTGVFVLPSHFEPWGVVVHEFAAAGFPLVCSDQVGARLSFVEDGRNGFVYPSADKKELKKILKRIMSMSDGQLQSMANESAAIAGKIRPETWSQNLMGLISSN
jgi:glycosyltransferase involved in cell wall biosynthesis